MSFLVKWSKGKRSPPMSLAQLINELNLNILILKWIKFKKLFELVWKLKFDSTMLNKVEHGQSDTQIRPFTNAHTFYQGTKFFFFEDSLKLRVVQAKYTYSS